MQDLGTLGGNNSCAYGINNAGQVVGQADTATTSHAFLYSVGNMSDLGDMCGGTGTSVAYGINNSGVVVGQATARVVKSGIEYRPGHAFVYGAGGMQDLGTLPWDDSIQIPPTPSSEARAISDSGQIVGVSDTAVVHNGTIYATNHAFSCRGGQMDDLYTLPPDFTVVGPATSVARAVNVGGDIAGWSTADVGGDFRPFLYTQSGMQGLGSLGGMNTGAYGINTGGQIVGLAGSTGVDIGDRAFLYSNASLVDLNSLIAPMSGWTLTIATAINDSGQIVGAGFIPGNSIHAYLLTPALPGDANLDGTVNGADLNTVLSNYNRTVSTDVNGWMMGDFDGNGMVNGADLNAVLSNYNQTVGAGAAVPEPSEVVLLACGLAALFGYAWKRRR